MGGQVTSILLSVVDIVAVNMGVEMPSENLPSLFGDVPRSGIVLKAAT